MAQAVVWTGRPLRPEATAALDSLATIFTSVVGERGDWPLEAAGVGASVIVMSGTPFVTGADIDRVGPHLRVIARPGIGVDRIDLEAATARGIQVINSPDGPTESTAEHAIALMLNLCKRVTFTDNILRSGHSFPELRDLPPGFEVYGAVLGLVGLGRIGTRVAAIARALGMRVLAFDPYTTPEHASAADVELVPSLEELLSCAQVVSLHCPATPETYHLMNAHTLALMPRGSYLINAARGALIDETALLAALRSGHLAGAALDVFDPEPPMTSHPIFTLPNVICTPHIASYTSAGFLRMETMACQQIASILRGERPANLVNGQVWERRRA
jgi:phosphoglycerate dehydrogenase-like enzyme